MFFWDQPPSKPIVSPTLSPPPKRLLASRISPPRVSRNVREAERRRLELERRRAREAKSENERIARVVQKLKTRNREKRETMFESITRSLEVAEERRMKRLQRRKSLLREKHSNINEAKRETKRKRLQYSESLNARLIMKQAEAAARRETKVKHQRKRKRDMHETKKMRVQSVAQRKQDRLKSLEREIEARVESARVRRIERLRNIRANAHAIFERLLASSPLLQSRSTPKTKPPPLDLASASALPRRIDSFDSQRLHAVVKIQRWIHLLQRCKALRFVSLRHSFDVVGKCRSHGPKWSREDDYGMFSSCGFEDFAKRVKEASVRIAAREIVENCCCFERTSSFYQKARQFLVAVLISKFPHVVSSMYVTQRARALDHAFSQLSDALCDTVDSRAITLIEPLERFDLSLNAFCITFAIWLREDRMRLFQDAEAAILSINHTILEERRRLDDDDDGGGSSSSSCITAALESMRESIQHDVIDVLSSNKKSYF